MIGTLEVNASINCVSHSPTAETNFVLSMNIQRYNWIWSWICPAKTSKLGPRDKIFWSPVYLVESYETTIKSIRKSPFSTSLSVTDGFDYDSWHNRGCASEEKRQKYLNKCVSECTYLRSYLLLLFLSFFTTFCGRERETTNSFLLPHALAVDVNILQQ